MRFFVVALVGGILGIRTWLALCLSALAAVVLLVGGLDSEHGEAAASLHHAGLTMLSWIWSIWVALWLVTKLRRRR